MNRTRLILWLIAVAVVIVLLAALVTNQRRTNPAEYRTTTVATTDLTAHIAVGGTCAATTTVIVGCQVSGTIAEILVEPNQVVQRDQVLARLDRRRLDAELASAQAKIASAEAGLRRQVAGLERAKRDLARYTTLNARQIATTEEVETRTTTVLQVEADVALAEAGVAQAKADAQRATVERELAEIRAPIAGTILARKVELGQTVAASFQTPELFTIAADLTDIEVALDVPEADITRLKPGQPAVVTVDAWPERIFSGTVREVRLESQTIQNVVTYRAIIGVANPDQALRPGMSATVSVTWDTRQKALTLSERALRYRPTTLPADLPVANRQQGERLVWVLRNAVAIPAIVKLGLSDGESSEALSGLVAGDQVIISSGSGFKTTLPPGPGGL